MNRPHGLSVLDRTRREAQATGSKWGADYRPTCTRRRRMWLLDVSTTSTRQNPRPHPEISGWRAVLKGASGSGSSKTTPPTARSEHETTLRSPRRSRSSQTLDGPTSRRLRRSDSMTDRDPTQSLPVAALRKAGSNGVLGTVSGSAAMKVLTCLDPKVMSSALQGYRGCLNASANRHLPPRRRGGS